MKNLFFTATAFIAGVTGSYGQIREIEDDVNIFPDPANKTMRVVYTSTEKMPLDIKVQDANGKTVYSESLDNAKGKQVKIIDMTAQMAGTYTVVTENKKMHQVELVTIK